MAADLNDPDLIAANRRARAPSVSAPSAGYSPEVQARLDATRAASQRTVANAQARNPLISVTGETLPEPRTAYGGGATPERISLSSDAAGNTIVNGGFDASQANTARARATGAGFAPEAGVARPAPATSFEAGARALPSVTEGVGSSALRAIGGRAGILGAVGTAALHDINKPTEAMTSPDFGDAAARAVGGGTDLGSLRRENAARLVGDVATRAVGTGVDVVRDTASMLGDAAFNSLGTPSGVAVNAARYFTGQPSAFDERPASATPIGDAAAAQASASPSAQPSGPHVTVSEVPLPRDPRADPVGAGAYPVSPTSVAGISRIDGRDGVPIYTNVPASTRAELASNNGQLRATGDQSLTFPGVASLTRDEQGNYTGGTIGREGSNVPSVTSNARGGGGGDDGEDERASILDELRQDAAGRRKQLSRLVNESEMEALRGHKRRASILANLAGLYDKGTPDYAAFARANKVPYQTPEQRDLDAARADRERSEAFSSQITAQQKQRLGVLQQQLAGEDDPKKREALYRQIDAIGGNQGRRYQFPSVVSGYDELGRPQHTSYRADTYTGNYEELLPSVSQ